MVTEKDHYREKGVSKGAASLFTPPGTGDKNRRQFIAR